MVLVATVEWMVVVGGTLKLEQLKLVSQLSQQTKVRTYNGQRSVKADQSQSFYLPWHFFFLL